MRTISATWPLNSSVIYIPLRAAWLACTIVAILSTRLIIFGTPNANFLFWTFELISYLSITASIIAHYRRNKKKGHHIVINDGFLYVPRTFRKCHKVKIEEINSLETFANAKEIFGVLVGRSRKTPIFIDKNVFTADVDFNNFLHLLCTLTAEGSDSAREMTIPLLAQRQAKDNWLLALLSITLLVTYLANCDGPHQIGELAVSNGALIKASLGQNEWYRIGSSFFLHSSLLHLSLNLVSLALIGRNIQILLGPFRLVNILLFSAVGGALASLAFSQHEAVIGSSGGIFGLYGAYFLINLKYNRELPGSVFTSNWSLTLALALQLIFDATSPGVDGFSHLGGFLFGFAYVTGIIRGRLTEASKPSKFERALTAGLASFFAYALLKSVALSVS
jgi:membrane associated rhomboid family serine protease